MRKVVLGALTILVVAAASPLSAQSVQTDDNIETDGQLVSNVGTGTAPLVVGSTTHVPNLNANYLQGLSAFDLLTAMATLDKPDPPCFNSTHRFVDCGNGTVTDTVTGLIYLKDANCFGELDWPAANEAAAALHDGCNNCGGTNDDCGLSDGSRPGDWRLPTDEEWDEIDDSSCPSPVIVGNQSSTPGCYRDDDDPESEWASRVEASQSYWSSSTAELAFRAYVIVMYVSAGGVNHKTETNYVWPVRGGQ